MKTVIFFAVLIFAAQSSTPVEPIPDFYGGFILSLPMEKDLQSYLLKNGLQCIYKLEKFSKILFDSLYQDFNDKDHIHALQTLLSADEYLENNILPQCISVHQLLKKYWETNRVPYNESAPTWEEWQEKLTNKFIIDMKVYEVYAQIANDMADLKFFGAGEKFAYAGTLLNGMTKFELEFVQGKQNRTKATFEQFLNEYIPGLVQELAPSYYNNATFSCLNDIFTTLRTAVKNPNLHNGDKFTATHALLEGAILLTDSVKRCSGKVDLTPIGELARKFASHPFRSILKIIANEMMNLTTSYQGLVNHATHFNNGDLYLAGKQHAKLIKMILKDLAF